MLLFSPELVWHHLRQLTASNRLVIAYSGGLDSHVLLHCLVQLRQQHPSIELLAVHIHHGLSPNASTWGDFTQKVCERWQVSYHMRQVNLISVKQAKLSIEAAARQARYNIFREFLNKDACLLTAHTQNDQAETLLLQLLRGAGPKGLAAMPAYQAFGKGFHARPLLNFTRTDLETYAVKHCLHWIEDESNYQLQFDRNYLRHCLMPLIQQRWPSANAILARSASHCAAASHLLSQFAQQDLKWLSGSQPNTLAIDKLQPLNLNHKANVLREWLQQLKFPLPSTVKLLQVINEVIESRPDAQPLVIWQGVEIRRYKDNLFALKATSEKFNSSIRLRWNLQEPLLLPNNLGTLAISPVPNFSTDWQKLSHNLTIRFRQGGEICNPLGRQGRHKLKKLMHEWQIPPWQRDKIPLVFLGEQLMAVTNYCICQDYPAYFGEYQINWLPYSY